METNKERKNGNGLINPHKIVEPKEPKKISVKQDGLMEREKDKVVTEDGRELLKEN